MLLTAGYYQAAAQAGSHSPKSVELAKFIDRLSGKMQWKLLYNPDDLANKFADTTLLNARSAWTIDQLSTLLRKYSLELQPVGESTYAIKKSSPPRVAVANKDTAGKELQNEIMIRGTIRTDSAVLPGATVMVKSNTGHATTSDEHGKYIIKAPANGT
jgi:hypothetical protein